MAPTSAGLTVAARMRSAPVEPMAVGSGDTGGADGGSASRPDGFQTLIATSRRFGRKQVEWPRVMLWAGLLVWLTANTALFVTLLNRTEVQTSNIATTPEVHGPLDRGARGPWAFETLLPQPPADRSRRP